MKIKNIFKRRTKHSIPIDELLKRPIIRNDSAFEFLNKMTDEEIRQWNSEVEQMLIEEKAPRKFPDWNAAFLAKKVDTDILYNLFKLADSELDVPKEKIRKTIQEKLKK